MLTKIMSGAIAILGLALWWVWSDANSLRETNAKQSIIIADQKAELVKQKESIDKLNKSIVVYTTETERINNKNKKLSAQLNKLRGRENVKIWLDSMPVAVDRWLWKNYGQSKVRRVQDKSRVFKANARAKIRKRRTLDYIKNLNTALVSCNRDKAAARVQNR